MPGWKEQRAISMDKTETTFAQKVLALIHELGSLWVRAADVICLDVLLSDCVKIYI
jgi:hypothetical protein